MTKLYLYILVLVPSIVLASIDGYKLAAGDTVSIHVYGQDDLSVTSKIDKSGSIKYPFIGKVPLAGKTTDQVNQFITQALMDGYLVNPEVHVYVSSYRPFYIHGQVKKPGAFAYQPELTLSKAIALAGGLTERASSTWILKRTINNQNKSIKADEQTEILPGDIITIEQSFF
ncbi:polysaccharide export protein [Catenovulum agarivorans DS-2]|uniref:Polysaccharide export protein n=1 Tax=Catenovulum agarivorans DS-2 TaxID=1328313 RepID=W7QJH9_9ALTE|nr:polysaccharide biosynthesis/export family protein [Catenovulum agarivorans]EWH09102.1 polysaccharide export protein [Catenovulum agarivorans DS-2]